MWLQRLVPICKRLMIKLTTACCRMITIEEKQGSESRYALEGRDRAEKIGRGSLLKHHLRKMSVEHCYRLGDGILARRSVWAWTCRGKNFHNFFVQRDVVFERLDLNIQEQLLHVLKRNVASWRLQGRASERNINCGSEEGLHVYERQMNKMKARRWAFDCCLATKMDRYESSRNVVAFMECAYLGNSHTRAQYMCMCCGYALLPPMYRFAYMRGTEGRIHW